MVHNNALTLRILRLEAQREQNTRDQASLRHKLLFSRVEYHQSPEGQKVISDELDGLVRVGIQIRALLEAAEREAAEAAKARAAAEPTNWRSLPGLDRGVQNYF